MKNASSSGIRILAIAPSTRGFGFAILEGDKVLVDWGAKFIQRDTSVAAVSIIKRLMVHYEPTIIALKTTRKANIDKSRTRMLTDSVIQLASTCGIRLATFSRQQIVKAYFCSDRKTKYDVAQTVAREFSQELG